MNTLNFLSQSYFNTDSYLESTTSLTSAQEADIIAIVAAVYIISLIVGLITYVIVSLCLMRIFKKAGQKEWIAWVPFYNNWKMLELGGQQGYWAVLAIIPFVNLVSIVFMYISMYHIGKKLGKAGEFVLLAIFLPLVWYIWLAADKSTWNDDASTAPSLAS